MGLGVDQQILGLDVSVADACPVNVLEGPAHLISVQLDEDVGHALVVLGVVLADPVHGIWHELQHQVQVRLVLLRGRVETVLEADDVGVVHHLHDLQLPVLKPLILQRLLDGHLQVQWAARL